MQISATEFKAKCLKLIDRVHDTGESLVVTKRGKPVVEIKPSSIGMADPFDKLKGSVVEYADPFAPSVADSDIAASL